MGLYKEKIIKLGIPVTHWAIIEFSNDRERKIFSMNVCPYVSKEIKNSGGISIISECKRIHVEDIVYPPEMEDQKTTLHYTEYFSPQALEGKDIYNVMYTYLKEHIPFFKDATDDL